MDFLAFGNLYLGGTLRVGPLVAIAFGGEVHLGYGSKSPSQTCVGSDFDGDGPCLRGAAYFGVGALPEENWFYASVSSVTVGKILGLVGLGGLSLPSVISESGFPEGLDVSYALVPIELSDLKPPVYIQAGFTFEGAFRFLGLPTIRAYINVDPDAASFDLRASMDAPWTLGPIVKVARASDDQGRGPMVAIALRPLSVSVKLQGYLNLLGGFMSGEVSVEVSTSSVTIRFTAPILSGLLRCHVLITASVSSTLAGNFGARFTITDGLSQLIEAVKRLLTKAFNEARAAINGARDEVAQAKEECLRNARLDCDACKSLRCQEAVEDCKRGLGAAGEWIGDQWSAAASWLSSAFSWLGRHRRRRTRYRRDHLRHGGRRTRVVGAVNRSARFSLHPNEYEPQRERRFIDEALCDGVVGGGCRGVESLCEGACEGVSRLAQGLCSVLDVADGVLQAANTVNGWAESLANALLDALGEVFQVHRMEFGVNLSTSSFSGNSVCRHIASCFGCRSARSLVRPPVCARMYMLNTLPPSPPVPCCARVLVGDRWKLRWM